MADSIRIHFCDFGDMNGIANVFTNILSTHFTVILDKAHPQYIFYSVFGVEHLKYDCVRIFYTGENITPNFNICDYAIGFEHINFLDRYIRYPLYLFYEQDFDRALNKHKNVSSHTLEQKSRFCNFVVSNNRADSVREAAFYALNTYKKVDSGGRYLNNIGGAVADKYAFQKQCIFSLCFENSSSPGYLTEKLIQAAGAQTIPIYWGDTHLGRQLNDSGGGVNTKALIYAHDFGDMKELVDYVRLVDNDKAMQLEMMQQPLFLDSHHKSYFDKQLCAFLLHIFSQPHKNAFRRGLSCLRLFEEQRYKKYMRILGIFKHLKSFLHSIRNFFYKSFK